MKRLYNDYYKRFNKECWDNIRNEEVERGDKWWDKSSVDDEINDMPILENKTGIESSEWVIFHHILIQLMVDYISNHPLDNEVYTYSTEIDLETGKWKNYLNDFKNTSLNIPDSDEDYTFNTFQCVCDKDVIDSYDGLTLEIYSYITTFIEKHKDKIKTNFTKFLFSADDIDCSLALKGWAPETDSILSIYSGDDLVICSM